MDESNTISSWCVLLHQYSLPQEMRIRKNFVVTVFSLLGVVGTTVMVFMLL